MFSYRYSPSINANFLCFLTYRLHLSRQMSAYLLTYSDLSMQTSYVFLHTSSINVNANYLCFLTYFIYQCKLLMFSYILHLSMKTTYVFLHIVILIFSY